MNLATLLTAHRYRPVINLAFEHEDLHHIRLSATFTPEAGPWHFLVPREAQKPFFVESVRLQQTLIVTPDGAFVGTTNERVIAELKSERGPSYRHFVDNTKRVAA